MNPKKSSNLKKFVIGLVLLAVGLLGYQKSEMPQTRTTAGPEEVAAVAFIFEIGKESFKKVFSSQPDSQPAGSQPTGSQPTSSTEPAPMEAERTLP